MTIIDINTLNCKCLGSLFLILILKSSGCFGNPPTPAFSAEEEKMLKAKANEPQSFINPGNNVRLIKNRAFEILPRWNILCMQIIVWTKIWNFRKVNFDSIIFSSKQLLRNVFVKFLVQELSHTNFVSKCRTVMRKWNILWSSLFSFEWPCHRIIAILNYRLRNRIWSTWRRSFWIGQRRFSTSPNRDPRPKSRRSTFRLVKFVLGSLKLKTKVDNWINAYGRIRLVLSTASVLFLDQFKSPRASRWVDYLLR